MIEVTCECGKRFSVGDQFAGKRGRCKACGRVVTVPAAHGGTVEAEPVEPISTDALHPSTFVDRPPDVIAAPLKPQKEVAPQAPMYPPFGRRTRVAEEKAPRLSVHVSPGLIVLVLLAIGIPTIIFLVEEGPIKAKDQWQKIEPTAEGNIISQVTRAIQHEYAQFLSSDENEGISGHKAINVVFFEPVIMIRLPDSIQIQGRTTEGLFKGTFHPQTMQFEATVPILGQIHKIDGSVSDDDQSLNLDGQKIN
jgi:hypothetical protein